MSEDDDALGVSSNSQRQINHPFKLCDGLSCILALTSATGKAPMALRKFIIEREMPKAGTVDREQLRQVAAKEVLNLFGSDIQWLESFAAGGKTFGVYLAEDEAVIRQHAEIGSFSQPKITEVSR